MSEPGSGTDTAAGIAYERVGRGEPLVLVHGIGHRRQAWATVAPQLRRRFDVIAIDLPGFGESPPAEDVTYDMDSTSVHLNRFFAELGLDRPHVAGNSLGGAIALELGARGLVRSVTALAPAGFWSRGERRYALTVLAAHRRSAGLPTAVLSRVASSERLRSYALRMLYARPDRVTVEAFLADSARLVSCPGYVPTATAGRGYDCHARPQVPTTIAWGNRDRILLPGQRRTAQARIPEAVFVELPDCGHIPMVDDPNAVASVISDTAGRAR